MFFRKYNQLSMDSRQVQAAATMLEVTEFRLFELAYREWFGCSGQERELESVYMLYWFTGRAPVWVRHFNRHILALSGEVGHEAQATAAISMPSFFNLVTLGCLLMSVLLLVTVI